jgi:hypothetical protein
MADQDTAEQHVDHEDVSTLIVPGRQGGEENPVAEMEDEGVAGHRRQLEGDEMPGEPVGKEDEGSTRVQRPEKEDDEDVNCDLPGNVSPLLGNEYADLEKEHLQAVRFSPSEQKYLSQYLLYKDKKKRVQNTDRSAVVETVIRCIGKIKQRLDMDPDFKDGELVECGSFYENTKVGNPHEFDFQYIMPLKNYTAKVAQMSKLKAKQSNLESKSFFKLYKTDNGEEIVAKDKHDAFQSTVEGILKDIFRTDGPIMTRKAGPAVKFVLKIPYEDENQGKKQKKPRKPRYVKVDLTMAYRSSPKHTFFGEVELRSYAKFLRNQEQLQCHFIPAHDFWKLSFTKNERDLMKKVSAVNYKGVCYRAIKVGMTFCFL